MKETFKLFQVKGELYLTKVEELKIGDKVIVTVADQFPTVVECQNDEQISLIQTPKLSMTKANKVVMGPEDITIEESMAQKLGDDDGFVLVQVEDGKVIIMEN